MSKGDRSFARWDIVSITAAAPGWRVVYEDSDSPGGYFEVPVACWALLRVTQGFICGFGEHIRPIWKGRPSVEREVHAMVVEDGGLEPAEPIWPRSGNYWGLLAPGQGVERIGPAPSASANPAKPAKSAE